MRDASNETQNYLIYAYKLPNMDILKVGHHVSKYSTSKSFLNAISSRSAIILARINNKYNHPHKETLERLEEKSIKHL